MSEHVCLPHSKHWTWHKGHEGEEVTSRGSQSVGDLCMHTHWYAECASADTLGFQVLRAKGGRGQVILNSSEAFDAVLPSELSFHLPGGGQG